MEFDSFRLAASTADLTDEPDARADADLVEFRLDLADEPLDALAGYDGDLPILATNRARWEGGDAPACGRLDTLAETLDHAAVVGIDIELATLLGRPTGTNDLTVGELVDRATAAGVTVVASVHDFSGTPDEETLDSLLRIAASAGDVGKLAVTAETAADALAVLSATERATARGDRVATMAMGKAGAHTRAVTPVYGSRIGYAPVRPEAATAPGQYDLATLRELVEELR